MNNHVPTIQSSSNTSRGVQHYATQIVILVIVSILVFWFLARPKMAELSAAKAQAIELAKTKDTAQGTLVELERMVNTMNTSSDDIVKLDEVLPLVGRQTKVHVMMEKYVQNAGMSLANVTVEPSDDKEYITAGNHELLDKPYGKVRTQHTLESMVSVTGTVPQFENLLKTLETSSRLMDVQTIDIKAEDNNLVSFRLKIITYFYEP